MKRALFILLSLCMLMSCIQNQLDNGTETLVDPVSECMVPKTAHCGDEVILQWNGFTDDTSIVLRSVAGDIFPTEVKIITGSGLIFQLPYSIIPDTYDVILVQEGEHLLGQIVVLAPEIPVSGISIPSSCMTGESIIIKGIGFNQSSDIVLIGSDGTVYEVEAVCNSGGLTIIIPSDLPTGEYSVCLVQDGFEWVMSDILHIMSMPAKELASVAYQGPYMGSTQIRYTWVIGDGTPLKIHLIEATVDADGTIEEGTYDEYTSVSEYGFELTVDGFETSNDLSMAYSFDSDGRIRTSDVLIYGKSQPTEFTWTYDTDGFMQDITYVSSTGLRLFRELEYENGNLVRFRNTEFDYTDPSLVNNPNAPDVVWGYMSVMEKFDPFVYFPYLLGWYDIKSSCLPSAFTMASGTGTITVSLEYVFDDEGYVTEMIWSDGGVNRVIFSYR